MQILGEYQSRQELIIPPLAGDRPALVAGFVFLGFTPWLVESTRENRAA